MTPRSEAAGRRRAAAIRRWGAFACCCGALLWVAAPGAAQPPVFAPSAVARDAAHVLDAATIVERALARASLQREAALGSRFEYFSVGVVESLDGAGNVTRTETSLHRHYPLAGHFYSELVERDGRPLDGGDARDERQRRTKFMREAATHASRGERYDPDRLHVDFDAALMARYHTTRVGEDVVRGDPCWVIRFEPRAGRLPEDKRIDKALNRSTGYLWITRDDYRVARITFEMQRPFRWLWGMAGTLRHAAGQFDLQWIGPDVWSLGSYRIDVDMSVLFGMKSIRRRIRSEWIEQPLAASAAP